MSDRSISPTQSQDREDDGESRPTVMVVDDEQEVADLYAMKLRERYNAWTAYNGNQALDIIDGTVDVVLLDRRMPGMSGDEVLRKIQERGLNCQVAMVTAVEPDFDIIEMGFDDYVVKPVTEGQLYETVENLLQRAEYAEYEDQVREYMSLASKRSVLESQMDDEELEESQKYQELVSELRELKDEIETSIEDDEYIQELEAEFGEVMNS